MLFASLGAAQSQTPGDEYFDHQQFEEMMGNLHEQLSEMTDTLGVMFEKDMGQTFKILEDLNEQHWEGFHEQMEDFHVQMEDLHQNMEHFHQHMDKLSEKLEGLPDDIIKDMPLHLDQLDNFDWEDLDQHDRDSKEQREKRKGLKKLN